jgi:hypothetical protein
LNKCEAAVTGEQKLSDRVWILLGQLAALSIAVIVALPAAVICLAGAGKLIEEFPERPFLASGILLLICAIFCVFLFLCFRGAEMTSRKSVYFLSRAVLLLVSAIAGAASLELLGIGSLGLAFERVEAYLWLAGGVSLVAFAAAGIRYAFGWQVSYWIIFFAVLAAVIFWSFGVAIFNFF